MGYAVVSSDDGGVILSVNSNACKLFGYAAEDMIGKKVNMLMPEPYDTQHDSYMARFIDTHHSKIIGRSRGRCTTRCTDFYCDLVRCLLHGIKSVPYLFDSPNSCSWKTFRRFCNEGYYYSFRSGDA